MNFNIKRRTFWKVLTGIILTFLVAYSFVQVPNPFNAELPYGYDTAAHYERSFIVKKFGLVLWDPFQGAGYPNIGVYSLIPFIIPSLFPFDINTSYKLSFMATWIILPILTFLLMIEFNLGLFGSVLATLFMKVYSFHYMLDVYTGRYPILLSLDFFIVFLIFFHKYLSGKKIHFYTCVFSQTLLLLTYPPALTFVLPLTFLFLIPKKNRGFFAKTILIFILSFLLSLFWYGPFLKEYFQTKSWSGPAEAQKALSLSAGTVFSYIRYFSLGDWGYAFFQNEILIIFNIFSVILFILFVIANFWIVWKKQHTFFLAIFWLAIFFKIYSVFLPVYTPGSLSETYASVGSSALLAIAFLIFIKKLQKIRILLLSFLILFFILSYYGSITAIPEVSGTWKVFQTTVDQTKEIAGDERVYFCDIWFYPENLNDLNSWKATIASINGINTLNLHHSLESINNVYNIPFKDMLNFGAVNFLVTKEKGYCGDTKLDDYLPLFKTMQINIPNLEIYNLYFYKLENKILSCSKNISAEYLRKSVSEITIKFKNSSSEVSCNFSESWSPRWNGYLNNEKIKINSNDLGLITFDLKNVITGDKLYIKLEQGAIYWISFIFSIIFFVMLCYFLFKSIRK